MVSQKFINHIIDNANKEDLQVFVKEVINSVIIDNIYYDDIVQNALELISGCAKPIHDVTISSDKILNYLHSSAYKGEGATKYEIIGIDNFKSYVTVKYNTTPEGEVDTTANIPFRYLF